MYQSTFQPNTRLHVADALRGIAIIGIILIHNVEHMDFYNFPEATNQWIIFLNKMTWDGSFFAFSNSSDVMYRILYIRVST